MKKMKHMKKKPRYAKSAYREKTVKSGKGRKSFLGVVTWLISAQMVFSVFGVAFIAADNPVSEVSAGAESGRTPDNADKEENDELASKNSLDSVAVSADGTKLKISVTLSELAVKSYSGRKLYLFELYPNQSVQNIGAFDPVMNEIILGSNYTFLLPFDKKSDQIYARYFCAVIDDFGTYSVITTERNIDDYSKLADYKYAYPQAKSKKGLSYEYIADAQYIGASHTVLNVPINEYFTNDAETGAAFDYCGKTYYIDADKLAILDHQIKTSTDADIHVYLDILLTAPVDSQPPELDCFYISEYASSVTYYAINTSDKTALGYFEAFMAFLAGRYTAPDGEHGFAGSYIVGYEINSNRYYNNRGECELEPYVNSYAILLRVADIAIRTVYSEARLYVSLSNNFNEEGINQKAQTNSRLDYSSRDTLDMLCKKAGDIPWNIAFYPYASEYNLTEIWKDENAAMDFDTPYITMANIEILCEYLSQSEFLYNGVQRSVAIAEFGVSAEPTDADALDKQAAAFAYAYYKAAALEGIESVIYYRQVDNRLESGIFFGLCTYGLREDDRYGENKPIYDVFRYIDTQRSSEFSNKYLTAIGIVGWNVLIPGFDVNNYIRRTVTEKSAIDKGALSSRYQSYRLFDFTDKNLNGFRPTENTSFIDIREAKGLKKVDGTAIKAEALYAALALVGSNEYMGISRNFSAGLNLSEIRYISFSIKAEVSVPTSAVKMMFRLSSDDRGNYDIYEGTAEIVPGEWSTVYFDLSSVVKKHSAFDHMTIWIKDADGNKTDENYSLWLSNVNVYKKDMSKLTRIVVVAVLIVSSALAVVCFVASIKILIIRRKKLERISRENQLSEAERQRKISVQRMRDFEKHETNAAPSVDGKNISDRKALKDRIEKSKAAQKKGNRIGKN